MQGESKLDPLSGAVRSWFLTAFPQGPTPAQTLAWPIIDRGDHVLLISPTGTGKTLAAFLAIMNRLFDEHSRGCLAPGLRCVYVSPLKSLGRDVELNLQRPLDEIGLAIGIKDGPIRIGIRSGDTSSHHRRKLRDKPPHILITTPESLSLMLSQAAWREAWKSVQNVIVDEVHSLVPNKRGADLALSLERLSSLTERDPCRIGLSATCRPADLVARFLVGPTRSCRVAEAEPPSGARASEIDVECLLRADESAHRGLTYRRLIRRVGKAIGENRTTLVFANTRAFTEKLTHDLRLSQPDQAEQIGAHHGSLDAERRHEVENALKSGSMRAVVTSTSLELGIDIGEADLAILVGLPSSTAQCLQRIGRAGHRPDAQTRGLMLAATTAEIFGSAVTAKSARDGRLEPLQMIEQPLDVLCQQLIAIACQSEQSCDQVFDMIRRAGSMASLTRTQFDACLDFLAGELAAPAGAFEPTPGTTPKWTSPRIWKSKGRFGIRSRRVIRWFWSNVGTIVSEESMPVLVDGKPIGRLEAAYAERLQTGDRFLLDGRSLRCQRNDGQTIVALISAGDSALPLWTSDRLGLSRELASELARFRSTGAHLLSDGPSVLRAWLDEEYRLDSVASALIESLLQAQEAQSEVPCDDMLLVEDFPDPETGAPTLAFHAPLGRHACEVMGRVATVRLGRSLGRNLELRIADLGWSIRLPDEFGFDATQLDQLVALTRFDEDLLEGLERGEILSLRFRHVAATALMVLKNPEGGRVKVGGLNWVSKRLYPLVKACCPEHPLLQETRREVLQDRLDVRSAREWLATKPTIRYRQLASPSPFASTWIDPASSEAMAFEAPGDALRRLHGRLMASGEQS